MHNSADLSVKVVIFKTKFPKKSNFFFLSFPSCLTFVFYEAQTLLELGCVPSDTYDYIELCDFLKCVSFCVRVCVCAWWFVLVIVLKKFSFFNIPLLCIVNYRSIVFVVMNWSMRIFLYLVFVFCDVDLSLLLCYMEVMVLSWLCAVECIEWW
jgi:hypothetical protein